MKVAYKNWSPKAQTLETLACVNDIVNSYQERGYTLTLRQLFYQLVTKNIIENDQPQYDRLGRILTNAREAGIIDWDAIEDRTRGRVGLPRWDNPKGALASALDRYRRDKWQNQKYRIFVWVEKEALAGVIERACFHEKIQVGYVCCRGYMSASTIYREARTIAYYSKYCDQTPIVIHLADHDPSGMDMTRDNVERLQLYSGLEYSYVPKPGCFILKRIALNYDQVEEYNPPPNYAKIKDSRAADYIAQFGRSSWELDALDPDTLVKLVRDEINQWLDPVKWEEMVIKQKEDKKELKIFVEGWEE